jgi:hypothetical protein
VSKSQVSKLPKKVWEDIEGFVGYYQISNHAEIRSLDRWVATKPSSNNKRFIKGQVMKSCINNYRVIRLSKDGISKHFLLHRLLALAFIPNPNNYPCVNHIDGNKLNNDLNNLEWCTYSYNSTHSYIIGKQNKKGENHHFAKLTEKDVREIRYMDGTLTRWFMSKLYNISIHTIRDICIGRRWSHI